MVQSGDITSNTFWDEIEDWNTQLKLDTPKPK